MLNTHVGLILDVRYVAKIKVDQKVNKDCEVKKLR